MKKIEMLIECPACKGTGVYSGVAETEETAVICNKCEGTGAYNYELGLDEIVMKTDEVLNTTDGCGNFNETEQRYGNVNSGTARHRVSSQRSTGFMTGRRRVSRLSTMD